MGKLSSGVSAFAMILIGGGGAWAADLPTKAPMAPYSPPWSWAGLYLGIQTDILAGGTKFSDPFGSSIFGDRASTPGYGIGGQIGYNWQAGNFVYGLEADAAFLGSRGSTTCGAFSGAYVSSNCTARPDANGTVTARFGYALGPQGQTLAYVKGGFAWQRTDVSATDANPFGLLVPVTNAQSLTQAGWTAGAGVEQALTPAWSVKFEYDYLNFGHQGSVTIPESAFGPTALVGRTLLFDPMRSAASGVSSDVHMFKLGLNYKLGQDPFATGWNTPAYSAFLKAPEAAAAQGWEFEGGGRYWYSWGKFQKDLPGSPGNDKSLVSRLTYDNLTANTGEFFGRVDTPVNVFVKGFVGGGSVSGGHMNDEDWGLAPPNANFASYSNTVSSATGPLFYGTLDIGYDLLHGPGYKVGAFVGYNRYSYTLNAGGCTQIASPRSDCVGASAQPTSQVGIIEKDTWDSVRVGASAETMLGDRWKLSGDVAYVPYTKFTGTDQHLNRNLVSDESGHGTGIQAEAFLTYMVTNAFSVGVGGRYWSMWTTSGNDVAGGVPQARNDAYSTERLGMTFQASYKF